METSEGTAIKVTGVSTSSEDQYFAISAKEKQSTDSDLPIQLSVATVRQFQDKPGTQCMMATYNQQPNCSFSLGLKRKSSCRSRVQEADILYLLYHGFES
ncbi:hypothetical protein TNCV_1046421 [Trichonephila clavipes]|nr:hypothetical protein TNCV_1046421 [Trichonephila clavipes]